jgi:hypothetical protein
MSALFGSAALLWGSGWILAIMPLAVLTLILGRLACLRICIDDSGFEYHDLIGKSFRLNYSDIRALTTKSRSIGRGRYHESTFHLRNGRNVRTNLFPFGQVVYRQLQDRISDT